MKENRKRIGRFLAEHRRDRKWTLEQVSQMTGVSVPTLSKVESKGQISFDTLLRLVNGLGLNLSDIFEAQHPRPAQGGRRTVTRAGEAKSFATDQYDYEMHAGDIRGKRMIPLIMHIKARHIDEFELMSRHDGEEWVFVLEGSVVMYSEFYSPLRLEKGDSVYFDSSMPHAFVTHDEGDATLLSMCAGRSVDRVNEAGFEAMREGA